MIQQIQTDTNDAVVKIKEGTGEVDKGQDLVAKSGSARRK